MELLYAGLLLHKAKKEINEDNVKKLLDSVGIAKSDGEIKSLVAALKDINIDDAIKEAASQAVVAAPAASGGGDAPKKEEKKEEEEKPSSDQAAAGLGALFG